MKAKMTGLGLAMACGLAGMCNTALSQDWNENFEAYSNGQVLYQVGGWTGWDDTQSVCGSATTARAHGGTKSVLIEGADDAIHQFTGLTSGSGTISAWIYIPVSSFVSDTYFIIQNVYNHGGPYDWCIEVQFDFEGDGGGGPGTVVDDFRTETNAPPIQFDTWVQIRCEVDIDNDTITTYYGNTEVSTGILFVDAGVPEIANMDLFTLGTTSYYDDIAVLGLGSGGGACSDFAITQGGSCPGPMTISWTGAPVGATKRIIYTANNGSGGVIPPGNPCAGTTICIGLAGVTLHPNSLPGTATGTSPNFNAPCGLNLQLITQGGCDVSNAIRLQ